MSPQPNKITKSIDDKNDEKYIYWRNIIMSRSFTPTIKVLKWKNNIKFIIFSLHIYFEGNAVLETYRIQMFL